jgi:heme-degrading monooxygenase HmoA
MAWSGRCATPPSLVGARGPPALGSRYNPDYAALLKEKEMLLERAEILVREGMEKDFAAAMKERGIALLASTQGVESVNLGRGVESPDKFMLLVEWESMEAHIAFTKGPSFTIFREVIGPFSRGGSMEHFDMR